jgi:mRNA interferase MazF
MTISSRADVVLVSFVFSDETGIKRRPAVIVSSAHYNGTREEIIVAGITSNTQRRLPGDHVIEQWQQSGIALPSVATGILQTIKQTMIARKLGTMPTADMRAIDTNLRGILDLDLKSG